VWEVLLVVGRASSIALGFFAVVVLFFGTSAMKPAQWNPRFRGAAEKELRRRGMSFALPSPSGRFSSADLHSVSRMLGADIDSAAFDDEASLQVIRALTGSMDESSLREALSARSIPLMERALARQGRAVAQVQSIATASYVWAFWRAFSKAEIAFAGVVWLIPRCIRHIRPLIARWVETLTLAVGFVGVLVLGVTGGPTTGQEWANAIGTLTAVAFVVGLVVAVIATFSVMATYLFGPLQHWTIRGVISGVIFVVVGIGLWLFIRSDFPVQLMGSVSDRLASMSFGNWAPRLFGSVVVLVCLAVAMRNVWQKVRLRLLMRSSRLVALLVLEGLFLFALATVWVGVDAPRAGLRPVVWVFIAVGTATGGAAAVCRGKEWIIAYRHLRAARIAVPLRGFRWWALAIWVGLLAQVEALEVVPRLIDLESRLPTLGATVYLCQSVIGLALLLSFFPGAAVTGLYVRRVLHAYQLALRTHASSDELDTERSP